MRRLLLFVGIPIVVLLAVVLALPFLIDANQFRPQIQAQLEKQLQRPVTLGDMGVRVFPLAIRVNDLHVGETPTFPSQLPFAAAKEIDVSVSLGSLLGKQIEVTSLRIRQPAIELIRNAQGVWNTANLTGSSGGGGGRTLALEDVRIEDGTVGVTDLQTRQPRQTFDHIDVRLRGLAPGRQMEAELTVHLPGKGKELISFHGQGAPNFAGKLSLEEVSLAGLREFLKAGAMDQTDGVVSGTADVQEQSGVVGVRGKLTLNNGRVRGADLGYPLTAAFDVAENTDANLLKLNRVDLKLGSVPVSITGQVNTSAASTIDVAVHANNASVKEVVALARAFTTGMGDMSGTGTLTLAVRLEGPAANPRIGGSISMPDTTLNLGGGSKPIVFRDANAKFENSSGQVEIGSLSSGDLALDHVRSNIALDRGVIRMAPLTAGVYGGQANGSITIDTRSKRMSYALNSKLEGVDANKLLSATASIQKVYGALAVNTDATMVSGPDSLRTLNGTAGLKLTNGKIAGVNLLNELASIGKFLGYAKQGQPVTNVTGLSGDFKIDHGVANSSNLRLDIEGATVAGTGTIDLGGQTLNLHITAVLNQGFSQRVGGSQIGGFMSTALANSKGELVIPALVTGTFEHPRFEPDVGAIAQMKLHNLLPTAGNPGALTTGILGALTGKGGGGGRAILDAISGKQAGAGAQPSDQKQPGALQGIMDAFRKDKPAPKSDAPQKK